MPNRKTKPTSPGRRFATYPLREQLTASEPEKSWPPSDRQPPDSFARRSGAT